MVKLGNTVSDQPVGDSSDVIHMIFDTNVELYS